VVIGRKGSEIDKLKEELSKMTGKEIYVDIMEIKSPEIDAQLVAENVALQLERRVSFRRAMKKALQTAKDFGADGIKIRCAGRLGGAEQARVEKYHWGRVRCTRCARTLITVLPRPTRFTASSEEVLDLQG
jgi:small subunit ribosomal protein S3